MVKMTQKKTLEMAYLSSEDVKTIRNRIKEAFPLYKWSVTREHATGVRVALMESDLVFPDNYDQINHYYIDTQYAHDVKAWDVLLKVLDIITNVKEYKDRNFGDPGADYPNMTYFISMSIGKWDKPHKTVTL